MRKAAGILLIFAFVLDMLAGVGYITLGVMGGGMIAMMGAMMGEMATVGGGDAGAFDDILKLGGSLGGAVAGVGLLIMVAGVLALVAALRLLRQRPGKIVYLGSGAAIVADAAPLLLLGFNPFQVPGLLGGVLGILAARQMAAGDGDVSPSPPAPSVAPEVVTTPRPVSRVPELLAGGAIVIGVAMIAFVAYVQLRPGGPDGGTQHAAPIPMPAPPAKITQPAAKPAAPAAVAPSGSGPVAGQLAGLPFNPKRVALKTQIWTQMGSGTSAAGESKTKRFEKIALVLEQRDDLQIEIASLPEDYDFKSGLELRVSANDQSFGSSPTVTLKSPKSGSSFGNTDFIHNGYELDLRLQPLDGNRVDGQISLSMPPDKRTRVAGTFRAWVDGQLEIEPDLSRGGSGSFRYLVYQRLKGEHPGAAIAIEDSTWSHQNGDPVKQNLTGHMKAVYTVDGNETASTFRMATADGQWRVVGLLPATQLPEAHPDTPPDPEDERSWVRYLAAQRTETWIHQAHPGKYPWYASHTGTTNTKVGYADIRLRLQFHGESEAIEKRYYYRRENGEWRYIRDLNKDEKIEWKTGEVVTG